MLMIPIRKARILGVLRSNDKCIEHAYSIVYFTEQ